LGDKIDQMESIQIKLRRNFVSQPFLPLMSLENKLQVERKVIEVIGELYGNYKAINMIEPADSDWLKSIEISLERDALLDAGGANDDHPVGRGVFIDE
jgi:hypothetical protein